MAAPTPMPACAPVDSPEGSEDADSWPRPGSSDGSPDPAPAGAVVLALVVASAVVPPSDAIVSVELVDVVVVEAPEVVDVDRLRVCVDSGVTTLYDPLPAPTH